jgi:deazaflavin-dependent oxidoreductase (nitroreductase family)
MAVHVWSEARPAKDAATMEYRPMNEVDVRKRIAAHVELYQHDPEAGMKFDTRPLGGPGMVDTLLLTTTGRASGQPRTTPLIFGEQPSGYVVVASNGGRPQHPFWYLNLQLDPGCWVQVGQRLRGAEARELAGADREVAWALMADIYPPYEEYQRAAAHTLPVLLLKRVERISPRLACPASD